MKIGPFIVTTCLQNTFQWVKNGKILFIKRCAFETIGEHASNCTVDQCTTFKQTEKVGGLGSGLSVARRV